MKVSIITTNYNGEKTLSKTIESILEQTYNNIEYIIIDGKSTDKSIEIIKSYEKKFKEKRFEYKWISEEDSGIFNAMNKGIKISSGDIIGIIGSDDWYEKETLEIVASEFEKDKELDMVYGILRTVNKDSYQKIIGDYNSYGRGQAPTIFLKKETYKKYGTFNEKYKIAADSDLLLRLKNQNVRCKFIERILTNFSLEGISNTNFLNTSLEDLEVGYINGIYSRTEKNIRYIYIWGKYLIMKILKKGEKKWKK